jgi:DnaJ-class molecular chaperone
MFNFFGNIDRKEPPTKLYETLGLTTKASPVDIKRAYRALAKKHHPDKGGTDEMFKSITAAYEVLSNEGKRRQYDTQGDQMSPTSNDLFSAMFARAPPRIKPVSVEVLISLEDIVRGHRQSVPYETVRNCVPCTGKGGSDIQACATCRGKGVYIQLKQIGPGMVQQVHTTCAACKGKGTKIHHICSSCKGVAHLTIHTSVDVTIPPNTPHGTMFTIQGKGHEVDGQFGDVIVTVVFRKHTIFTPSGNELHMTQTIDIVQALCGYSFQILHLNGTTVTVQSSSKCIQPGSTQIVPGLGMTPKHSLHITYSVVLPITFAAGKKEQLVHLLNSTIHTV